MGYHRRRGSRRPRVHRLNRMTTMSRGGFRL